MKPVLQFCAVTLGVTALITGAGALLGAALWPLIGAWAGSRVPLGDLTLTGARTLGFYCFIWAPGTGIVVATIHAHRRRRPRDP
ncbi:MAG TPA: hypothetical protein PK322_03735 [Opitutaceae bacterium]|nr:hypothetical protein [Opitutaceae bacterium]